MDDIDLATDITLAQIAAAVACRPRLAQADVPSDGWCRDCGGRIEAARLRVQPYTRYCRDCAGDVEADAIRAKRRGEASR